jgi:hypothetical protein
MAKDKKNAIYDPGELDRVRGNLGSLDPEEAKRMAQKLGGDVGVERAVSSTPVKPKVRHETVDVQVRGRSGGRSGGQERARRPSDSPGSAKPNSENKAAPPKKRKQADDPAIALKQSYGERVKMDRLAGSAEFGIKNPIQVLHSILSLFHAPPDLVSNSFVNHRMNEYYKYLETLVTATRTLLPRSNMFRNEQFKRLSPQAYAIIKVFHAWNIELIGAELARIQASPRNARVEGFKEILKAIYKPLFILEQLDYEAHIKESFSLLYRVLVIENPSEAENKQQELIRSALSAYGIIRRDIRFLLYPLLLKLLSDKFFTYTAFFSERPNRIKAFLGVSDGDRLPPEDLAKTAVSTQAVETDDETTNGQETANEGDLTDEEREKRAALAAERKALDRGLDTLETLFPKARWDRIAEFPDFYPYFTDVFGFGKDYVLLPPTDPLQQVVILMRILEELFFGVRYVSFGIIPNADGIPESLAEPMTGIMSNWHSYIDVAFGKEYLPRLAEYCRIFDSPGESRTSPYARRLSNELHWTKRLYFLPYYRFESSGPPPFQKNDITALYPEIRRLRRYLTVIATGIEQGIKAGGPGENSICEGIENPWKPYTFQVPNPVSIRLDALMGKKKTNASLIFYTLAVTVVLDYLVNNESSWAYTGDQPRTLFRSVDGKGDTPVFGIDQKIDTQTIFKLSLKQRKGEA